MPIRNVIKVDGPDSIYHVYVRGNNKQLLFREKADYLYFIRLLDRYLSGEVKKDKSGIPYPNFFEQIELNAYCLMPNHFHLMLWQNSRRDMSDFMQSLMVSYCRYFNLKYHRSGTIFGSRYKAVRVDNDNYLRHISRYIHLNPRYWQRYPYSSLGYYYSPRKPLWLRPERTIDLFASSKQYWEFLKDYEDYKITLQKVKSYLADH